MCKCKIVQKQKEKQNFKMFAVFQNSLRKNNNNNKPI